MSQEEIHVTGRNSCQRKPLLPQEKYLVTEKIPFIARRKLLSHEKYHVSVKIDNVKNQAIQNFLSKEILLLFLS